MDWEDIEHHLVHPAAGLLAVDEKLHQVHLFLVEHQTIHNHHLLIDHRHLPIELVEHCLKGVRYTLGSMDSVLVALEHQSVIVDLRMLVCPESRVHEVESISYFGLEKEY